MSPLEKPWYTSTIVAFLSHDVHELVGISPAALVRDINTLVRRVTLEGESFLTKTLPRFGKSFDYALQERSTLTVSGFKKRSPRSALPAFLQALTRRVFTDEGHVLDQPCTKSIAVIRQLCYWCKKVEKGFTDESLRSATQDLIETDEHLPEVGLGTNPRLLVLARKIAERLVGDIPTNCSLNPRHGPGSVAWSKGSEGHGKHRLDTSYTKLERVFRPIPWFFSLRDASENPQRVTKRWRTEYGLSRLAFVEKDSSGPRVIGLEPAEYMWCQQAIKDCLYDHIEQRSLARGKINFTSQEVNRQLTLDWRRYDTLDMSKASDRNSYSLVKTLFGRTVLWRYLDASRTPGVVLPDGSVLFYKKFAPMGSATCFPVEAMVFYCLAVSSLVNSGYPFLLAFKNVFVYGDDIIVPHGYYGSLKSDFESVGLKFSDEKCCTSGKFRESCGLDAYDGVDVTPLRLRRPHCKREGLDLISLVEHCNALMTKGYWAAARELRRTALKRFSSLRKLSLPYTDLQHVPVLAWLDYERRPTLKIFWKNSRRFVIGYSFKPKKDKADAADESFYLRESLSLGGPTGTLSKVRGRWLRFFAKRFQGSLCFKRWDFPEGFGEKVPKEQIHELPNKVQP